MKSSLLPPVDFSGSSVCNRGDSFDCGMNIAVSRTSTMKMKEQSMQPRKKKSGDGYMNISK